MKQKYKITILSLIIIIITLFMIFTPGIAKHKNIAVVGSSSVQPVAEKLSEEYTQQHPSYKITVQGGGSTMGLNSIKKNSAQIGTYSTTLDDNPQIKQTKIATDAIAIITNTKNNLDDLTQQQIQDIFTGKITNWKQVGGEDAQIHVITREAGSGTRDAIEKLLMNNTNFKSDAIVQSSTGSLIKTVESDPNAIGYASLSDLKKDNNVKQLNVDEITPTVENVKNNKYPITRLFLFLTNSTPSNETQQFIDWTLSEEGQKIIADEGLIPVN